MKKTIRILALFLCLAMTFNFVACEAFDDFLDSLLEEPTNPTNPTDPTEPTGPVIDNTMKLDMLAQPFWKGDTMHDESIMLVAKTDAAGNVIEAPRAKLLFAAEKIESVKWYFHVDNGAETVTFTEGTDFEYKDGYIIAKGSITSNPILEINEFTTNMPYVTDKMLTGEQVFPGLTLISDIPSKTGGLYLPFTEGYQIVQMQLSVTYKHAENAWEGAVPEYLGEAGLKNTVEKLQNKENVNLLVFGDSISTGANSSSVLGIAPNLATWPQMLRDNLASYYGAEVTLKNTSVGGWTSSNGISGGTGWVGGVQVQQKGLADQFKSGDLKDFVPDVAVIGFGMNDATLGLSMNTFCNNIISMINTLRSVNPNCDIILVGTMLANPMAQNQSKNQTEYTRYLGIVAEKFENVSVVDIAVMHQDLLDSGKYYTEMSSNNVNHPNDFFARVYAMNLLSSFINFNELQQGTTPPPAADKTTYEKYIEKGYSALFEDPFIKNGVTVIAPEHDQPNSGVIAGTNATGTPSWSFAQWGTKFDLYDYSDREYFNGGNKYVYASQGVYRNGKLVPGKVLGIDSDRGTIYMELNASTEYDHPRQDGENWPHTLLSQDFGGDLVHISELSDLVMNMTYEITKFEDHMGASADSGKHCAQLVWYITLQNRTPNHPDYGSYVWFGITLWDNRISGASFGGYEAEDGGKADATHAFIYQPASAYVHNNGKLPIVGEKRTVDFHLMDAARRAFDTAKAKGYLGSTQWDDLYIGGMNFGFENTGTYDSAVQIDSVGVYYK